MRTAALRARLPRLQPPRQLAGRLALVSSLQLLLVAGSLSWFTYSLGRRSGLQVSEHHRQIGAIGELSQKLSTRLEAPRTINALNLLEIRSGHLKLNDDQQLAQLFWRQMQTFPVAYINYGSSSGDFIGVERSTGGQLLLNEDTDRLGRGRMAVSRLGPDGRRGQLLEQIPGLSSMHQEAWYTDAVRARRATWSAIYHWEDKPEIFSISYSSPVIGADGQLRGVIGVDMVLSQLSDWLATIWQHRDGLALIVEPDGRLVASSRPADTLQRHNGGVQRTRLAALRDPLAQALRRVKFTTGDSGQAQALRAKRGVLDQVLGTRVRIGARSFLLDASRWGQEVGLNWLLLTAVPAEPSQASSERTAATALVFSSLALLLAVLLTQRQIRELLLPLGRLQAAAEEVSGQLRAEPPAPLQVRSTITAADGLEMQALEQAIHQLVTRFNQASADLRRAGERQHQRDADNLRLLREKLHSSLEAAAIAHEINQPLSVLLLSSQLLLEQATSRSGTALPAPWRQQLQSIRDQAERVVITIEAMRALLRNVQTEPQQVDLREVARSAVLHARSAERDAGAAIDDDALTLRLEPAWVLGDAVQLQLAVVNVLRNALQATSGLTGRAPWVGIDLTHQDDHWCLSVSDNGPGFPADLEAEPLLRSSKPGGSGLGLFVVRTTVHNHSGQLELGRSGQGGACVRIRLRAEEPRGKDVGS